MPKEPTKNFAITLYPDDESVPPQTYRFATGKERLQWWETRMLAENGQHPLGTYVFHDDYYRDVRALAKAEADYWRAYGANNLKTTH